LYFRLEECQRWRGPPTLMFVTQLECVSHKFLATSSLIFIILSRSYWFIYRRVLTNHLRTECYHVTTSYLTGWNTPLRSLSLTICTARSQWIKLIPCLRFTSSCCQCLTSIDVSFNQTVDRSVKS